MIHEYQLRALPEQAVSEQTLKEYISREKGSTFVPSTLYAR